MYCKFCPAVLRSKTPKRQDDPEAPRPKTHMKHLRKHLMKFHAKTPSHLKKSPSNSRVINTFGNAMRDIYPEYNYEDLNYARNNNGESRH